jgi:hypothetical protein
MAEHDQDSAKLRDAHINEQWDKAEQAIRQVASAAGIKPSEVAAELLSDFACKEEPADEPDIPTVQEWLNRKREHAHGAWCCVPYSWAPDIGEPLYRQEIVAGCTCPMPLGTTADWHVLGWHHAIGCPLRPEGSYPTPTQGANNEDDPATRPG